MTGGTHFRAPMSAKLKIFTALFLALVGGINLSRRTIPWRS